MAHIGVVDGVQHAKSPLRSELAVFKVTFTAEEGGKNGNQASSLDFSRESATPWGLEDLSLRPMHSLS